MIIASIFHLFQLIDKHFQSFLPKKKKSNRILISFLTKSKFYHQSFQNRRKIPLNYRESIQFLSNHCRKPSAPSQQSTNFSIYRCSSERKDLNSKIARFFSTRFRVMIGRRWRIVSREECDRNIIQAKIRWKSVLFRYEWNIYIKIFFLFTCLSE